jgi:hypothetical protein
VDTEEFLVNGKGLKRKGGRVFCFVFQCGVNGFEADCRRENVESGGFVFDFCFKLEVALCMWMATTDWGGVGPQSLHFAYLVCSLENAYFLLHVLIFLKPSVRY